MVDGQVDLSINQNIRIAASSVREEVKSENHGAIAAVLEGHDAVGSLARLDSGEDVFDACLGDDLVLGFWEALCRRLSIAVLAVCAGDGQECRTARSNFHLLHTNLR